MSIKFAGTAGTVVHVKHVLSCLKPAVSSTLAPSFLEMQLLDCLLLVACLEILLAAQHRKGCCPQQLLGALGLSGQHPGLLQPC